MNSKVMLALVGLALAGAAIGFGARNMTGDGGGAQAVAERGIGSFAIEMGIGRTREVAEAEPAPRRPAEQDHGTAEDQSVSDETGVTESREAYMKSVYTTWGETDGPGAALWANDNLKGFAKSDALVYIADGWAESDPAGAAAWFNSNTTGEILEDAMREILEAWGHKNPLEAFDWTDNLDEFTRSAVMDALAKGWGAVDPVAAAETGMQLRDRDYGDDFLISVTTQWAGSNPQEAATWADGLQDQDLKADLYMELGTIWANTDPVAATAWVSGVDDPKARKIAERGIALAWSEHDPGSAMDWAVKSVTDPEQIERVIEEIMPSWVDADPNGAARWLNAREKGPQSDSVLPAFTGSIIDMDPVAAVTWAGEISDAGQRDAHMRELLGEWVALDGEKAREEIRKMELPDRIKQEFGTSP